MLQGSTVSTVWTDDKALVGFMNLDTHEDIYLRFMEKLRTLSLMFGSTYIFLYGSSNRAH
jgi:hypothetical protein